MAITPDEAYAQGLGWVPENHPLYGTKGFVGYKAPAAAPAPAAPVAGGAPGAPAPQEPLAKPTTLAPPVGAFNYVAPGAAPPAGQYGTITNSDPGQGQFGLMTSNGQQPQRGDGGTPASAPSSNPIADSRL